MLVTPSGIFWYKDNAFPLPQWLHERASMLCYRYIACLVYSWYSSIQISIVSFCNSEMAWFKSRSCCLVFLRWLVSYQGRVVLYFYYSLIQIKILLFCIQDSSFASTKAFPLKKVQYVTRYCVINSFASGRATGRKLERQRRRNCLIWTIFLNSFLYHVVWIMDLRLI